MAANTPFKISKESQESLRYYHQLICQQTDKQYNLRQQFRDIDLSYLRTKDLTTEQWQAKLANQLGDSNRIQNITVPIVKPQVSSAVDYQAAVFLTDYPLFGVVSDPQWIDQAIQFQAIIEENSIRGGWAREFLLFFTNCFKYNLAALEVTWERVITAGIETDLTYKGGQEGKPKQVIWQGNVVKNWDMYNTYFDTRCQPYDIPTKGEFVGNTVLMSKTALKTFINSLETKQIENIILALESPCGVTGYGNSDGYGFYIPQLNPDALVDANAQYGVDWIAYAGLRVNGTGANINYKGVYEVTTEYIRLMPSDFDIRAPAPNTPQIWKLIWVNHQVLIYAERQTNAHEKIPVLFGQTDEDGLGYQSKSLAKDAEPFQDVTSALMNSVLASRRRAVTDRVLYDPSRINEAQINNSNPSAKIPVRPSAYGKPVAEAVYQFPFNDNQAGISLQEIQTLVQFANVLNGQNAARQGQFVKGNKTDGQWESTMQNATSKDQRCSLLLEAQVFTPLKEIIKINTLQFQQSGTVFSDSLQRDVAIDPLELRKATLKFKVTDGVTPKEKVISGDTLKVGLQVIGSSPQLAQAYNVGPLFSYLMKTENADLTPFEKKPEQVAYEQAVGNWTALVQLALEKDQDPKSLGPQPTPEQFGYVPAQQDPATQVQQPAPNQSTTQTSGGV
jgi:hypothetical protein